MENLQTLDVMYAIRAVAAEDGMNFFTLLSAYLVVAYVVGSKLSTFQVWAISLLYTLFSTGPLTGFYLSALDAKSLNHIYGAPQMDYPWLVPTIMALGWVLSIAFMIDARRNPRVEPRRYDPTAS